MSRLLSGLALLLVITFVAGCKSGDTKEVKDTKESKETKKESVDYSKVQEFVNTEIKETKAILSMPENWVSVENDKGEYLEGPNKEVIFEFLYFATDDLDKAQAEADKKLAERVKGYKAGTSDKTKINEMPSIKGTGSGDGVQVIYAIIDAPAPNSSVFLGTWASADMLKKHEAEVAYIINKIKPKK